MKKIVMIIGSVTIISILAKVLSLLRDGIIAGQYGTSYITDAITIAYTIPNFLYLGIGGALTTAFISVYHSTNSEKLLFIQKSFSIVFMSALLITGISLIFVNPIINFFYRNSVSAEGAAFIFDTQLISLDDAFNYNINSIFLAQRVTKHLRKV